MNADTLDRLAKMRHDKRAQTAAFAARCFGGPVVVLAAVWWITR